jgi:hypothetical protein
MPRSTTNPDAAKSDFLDDSSLDAAVITAWVAPGHNVTFMFTPEAQRLADVMQPLAKDLLALRFTVQMARKQQAELARVWLMLRGLSAIAAMHFVYVQLQGVQRDGWAEQAKQLSDQANALLTKCSQSPAFPHTDGDLCAVDVLAVNHEIRRDLAKQIGDITNALKNPDLGAAYDALAKTQETNPNAVAELRVANLILGEAHEVVLLAAPFVDRTDTSKRLVDEMGAMLEKLMEQPLDKIKNDPNTGSQLDVVIPSWTRVALSNTANAAGATTPGVGPDHLLLKLLLLYVHRQVPEVLADPSKAARLRQMIVPAMHEILGLDKAEATVETNKLLDEGEALAKAKSELVLARASGTHTPEELEQLEKKLADADGKWEEANKLLRDEYLNDRVHLHDGPVANLILSILSALQVIDATFSLDEAVKAGDKRAMGKSTADIVGGIAAFASAAPAIRLRLVNRSYMWFETPSKAEGIWSKLAIRNVGKWVAPLASAISGGLQVWSGIENQSTSDEVIGGLNIIYGASFLLYAETGLLVAPVVGQVAGFLAFAISLGIGLAEEATQMTERFVKKTIDVLQKANWEHGDKPVLKEEEGQVVVKDPGDQKPLQDALGFRTELTALANTASSLIYYLPIPVPSGMRRKSIVDGLIYYTGSRDIAERMVEGNSVDDMN